MKPLELDEEDELGAVVAALHEIAHSARERDEDWDVCERALENLRKIASFADR